MIKMRLYESSLRIILLVMEMLIFQSAFYGQNEGIQILNLEQGNILNKVFIEAEILQDGFTGIKKFEVEIPISSFNDFDYNEHLEDYSEKINLVLFLEINYQNGIKNRVVAKYQNGQLCSEVSFDENGVYGLNVDYYEDGVKASQSYYENGKIVSPRISWYKNGMIKEIIDETRDKTIIKEWYKIGFIARETVCPYLSESDCYERLYYPNGKIKLEGYFNNGRTKFTLYWDNGKIYKQGDIYNISIAKLGKWIEWFENGKIKLESYYDESKPNIKVGKWKYWDENGNLIKEEVYVNGELISTKNFCK